MWKGGKSIFEVGSEFSKKWDFYNSNPIQHSLLNILDTRKAKQRKKAYTKYFSQAAIDNATPMIQKKLSRLITILQQASTDQMPVDLSRAFRCLAADVIVDYAFAGDFGGLDAKDFEHPLIEAADDLFIFAQWGLYFRRLFVFLEGLCNWLPKKLLVMVGPAMIPMKDFENVSVGIISCIQSFMES